ncbi:MAG: hypothetical protein EXQ95_13390 [Alphaproteobacteria bacterium]|nr:hypothetical protein [Alphaproteobacteria bacterium]
MRILAQFGGTTRLCTGVMVTPRIAVTAGRCVHQGTGGDFALDYWVQPGSDGTTHPFGQAFGSLLITFTEWTERSDPDFDIGFVVLDRALGERAGYASPTRTDGCGSYSGATFSWVGYAGTSSGQVGEGGGAACSDGALTASTSTTFAAGSPIFAADGRVHAVSSTRADGQIRFTRFNTRVLGYFTDSLLNSLDPCDLHVEADRVEFGAGSGEAMVAVTTGQGCSWTVEGTPPSWIEVQSGNGASFGRPVFRVPANTGAARSATLTLEGKPLAISQAAAGPAGNARVATASILGGSIVNTSVDTVGAGRDAETPAPAGATGGAGAWWRWTAPTTTLATATVTGDRFSPAVGVYTGTRPGALTLVAEGRETVSFTGVAGTPYLIFATGIAGGEGSLRLSIEQLFPGAEAQTGWWWNPAEPGRGVFLETDGINAFLGWFAYDSAGTWLWQVSRGAILTRRYYQGPLATFRDGQPLGGAYRVPSFIGHSGLVALSLSTTSRATLTAGSTNVPLERFTFATGGTQADRAPFAPDTGWWWTPSEPGTGYAIEVQGNQLMVGVFHFDVDGAPRWSIAMGPMSDPRVFEGTLVSYLGGQALGQSYRAPTSTAETGRIALLFDDATHAIALLPGGRQVTIERFRF